MAPVLIDVTGGAEDVVGDTRSGDIEVDPSPQDDTKTAVVVAVVPPQAPSSSALVTSGTTRFAVEVLGSTGTASTLVLTFGFKSESGNWRKGILTPCGDLTTRKRTVCGTN
uniref:(northern house mosquito) hypothetical protein n=1 Tax=Culex pipiens TaxID=7175 RepID=A0A8D8PKC4_CULPI